MALPVSVGIVIRSGAQGLEQWIREERDLYADYQRYIGPPPRRIVRIWLIARANSAGLVAEKFETPGHPVVVEARLDRFPPHARYGLGEFAPA